MWIDCEMTGLDLTGDALIEVAALVTDPQLNVLGPGIDVLIRPPAEALERMGDFVRQMHTTSGLLDELGYARADVLGLSWGGGIAQQFALQHPDRTSRLALVSTGTGAMMVPARLTVLAKMLTPRRYNDRRYRHDAGAEIYVGEDQAAVDEVFGRARPVAFRGYLFQLMALMSWTSLPVLPFIAAPTLVLAGRRDPVIPVVNAHLMGTLIPRATVHLHQGGHVGILTRPHELGPVLEDFLDG